MSFGSILHRSQSQRTNTGRPATTNASPTLMRRAEPRQAISRACLEAFEGRRLLSFTPAAESYPGGPNLVTADFNNDGRFDLVPANADSISALLGNGDGTFQPARTSAGGAAGRLVVGDVNADGVLDLVSSVVTDPSIGHEVRTQLGNGDGTFAPPVDQTIVLGDFGGYESPIAFGDLNGDGKLDVVVEWAQEGSMVAGTHHHLTVLLGRGDGTFAGHFNFNFFSTEGQALWFSSLAVADFDGDGKADVAVGGGKLDESVDGGVPTPFVKLFRGSGDGYLEAPRESASGIYFSSSLTVGDFNADATPDLIIVGYDVNSLEVSTILLGSGDGFFQAPRPITAQGAAGDVNADGFLDLVSANEGVDVFLGNGDGSFGAPVAAAAGPYSDPVVLGDFNADGRLDAAAADANGVSVLFNDGAWPPLPPTPPTVNIHDVNVTEGNTGTASAVFTVTLSRASNNPISIAYATGNGTATAGGDYTAASGTVTIPAGQTSATFTVPVAGDRLAEPSETFSVNLIDPTNATIGDGQGVGTILDDEPRISIGDVSTLEGKNGRTTQFTFTATLSAAYDQPVTTSFRTADGTARTSDRDYIAKAGTITFNPGETSKTITIEVRGDSRREANEAFYVDLLGNSSNSLFARSRGIGTILNDD